MPGMDDSVEVPIDGEPCNEVLTVKKINSLLSSVKTREVGLDHLNLYLPQCSDDDFIEWCVSWMQNCCKVDYLEKNSEIATEVLSQLFQISANYPELKKSVSFFISTRFFNHFFKCFVHTKSGWSCAASCFSSYKGACSQYQEVIEQNLRNILKKTVKIQSAVADCFALLPCLGGGGNEGINYRENWKNQFSRLLKICHSILNSLFIDGTEFEEYNTGEFSYETDEEEVTVDILNIQLFNYCTILKSMLLNKYPTSKCVPMDEILQLLCRGLAVTPKTLKKIETAHVIALRKAIPGIHQFLHSLLSATIVTCRSHLLPYSHVICKLIKQTLEWTESNFTYGTEKPFCHLRIQVYETMCNWLATAKNGSCIEKFSKAIISNAVSDIQSKKRVTLLKGSKVSGSFGSKDSIKRRINPQANCSLCFAGLKALQFLLKFSGVLLKAEEHKFLQELVVTLLLDVQNSSLEVMLVPYSVPECRKELYCLLLELVNHPCASLPPPTHFALRLFSFGKNDRSLTVSEFCSSAITVLMNIVHSQFDNVELSEKTFSQNQPDESQWVNNTVKTLNESSQSQTNGRGPSEENVSMDVDVTENEPEQNSGYESESSNVSSHEDSVATVSYTKVNDDDFVEKNTVNAEEKGSENLELLTKESEHSGHSTNETENSEQLTKEADKWESEPACKKIKSSPEKSSPVEKQQTPPIQKPAKVTEQSESPKKAGDLETPRKRLKKPANALKSGEKEEEKEEEEEEDCLSSRSMSLESPNEEKNQSKLQKSYFLRSKTPKPSSEEQEENSKKTSSPESVATSTSSKSTTKSASVNRRPRTRASSRLESVENDGVASSKKSDGDDYKDIIELFDDSLAD